MRFVRPMSAALALAAVVLALTGCSLRGALGQPAPVARPVPPSPTVKPIPATPPSVLPTPTAETMPAVAGNAEELKLALTEPAQIRYYIRVLPDIGSKSIDEAFADLDAEVGKLESNVLLLAIFPQKNHDIRFAMGPIFTQKKVSVDEMLALVRSEYLPEARKQDPATGLSRLIRSVNQRIAQ